ncbi:MAG: hypothetical protein PHE43_01050 [Candidatus Nanoarchaeia archaeon]|nr:hypothetical protein [Candidatus Nanoarchaeia archaeon]
MIITESGRKIPMDEALQKTIIRGGALWDLIAAFIEYKKDLRIEVRDDKRNEVPQDKEDICFILTNRKTDEGIIVRAKNALTYLNVKSSIPQQEINPQEVLGFIRDYIKKTDDHLIEVEKLFNLI